MTWSRALALGGLAALLGLMWLPPSGADAAILKRVHSGTTNIPSAAGVTIPLELPDASKAFVVCTVRTTSSAAQQRVTCVLSNNQLVIDGGSGIVTTLNVSWYVAEFESGVHVQRGTVALPFSTSTTTANFTAVDCSKSFVVMAGEQHDGSVSSAYDEGIVTRAILGTFASPCAVTPGTTASTLTIARNGTATSSLTVAWQVVTLEGATVLQRAAVTIPSNSLTAIGGIGTPSDPAKDFIVMSRAPGSAVEGMEAQYQVRAEFTTAFQITFTRLATTSNANEQVDIAYEVVRLEDGSSVQRGSTTSSGTTTTMGAAGNIAAVDRSAAVPFFSASGGSTSGSAAAQAAMLDETSWTAAFPSTTQLQFTRGTSSSIAGTASWFVVSFYKCPNSRLCSVGVTGGNASATVSWSPIYDPQCVSGSTPTSCQALVVRDTAAITWGPTNGTTYTVGTQPAGGPASMRVVFNGTGQSFPDPVAGLANGTRYYYRVYPRINASTNYITDAGMTQAISQVSMTPSAAVAWSYSTTGGSALNAPVAGTGKVYVASNGNKMVTLNSSTGLEVVTPVIAPGAIQSYLSWFPVSGGTNEAVVAADQNGWLTQIDGVTGIRDWTIKLPVDSGGFLQAALTVQLNAYTHTPYQCDGGAFQAQYPTTTEDLIYVVGRNQDRTKNQVWAVRADTDGAPLNPTPTPVVWTFPVSAGSPAIDRATGQPYVDYCRDRLWVSTGNNAGQDSLWVINTLDGTRVTSFPGVGDQTNSAPTLSYNLTTVYVGDAAGKVYAFDAATTGTTAKYSPLQLGGTGPTITGFVLEDWGTPGRLYIAVVTNGKGGVWCVWDNGSALVACPEWTTNPQDLQSISVVCSSAEPLVMGTAIFFPCTTSTNNGVIYQINTTDGALKDGTGRPFTVENGTAIGGLSTEDLTQLYVGTSSGRTYRINLTSGNLP